ncbi:hypothetical protein ACQP1P_37590 [Dactylosporangium sp. CA-052675]|uniref:hypothetical protein n=1 Tax=Dactylosporangium sp. CA-052675 TaxID=3239927 RepID=UPI003D91FC7C
MTGGQLGASRRGPAGVGSFAGTALSLLGRHFPALLALAAAGFAARWGATRLAVVASSWHPLAGTLLLMVVPLLVLMTYVLMMRVVRGSLPFARAAHDRAGHRGILDHLGSVLLPFLAVWSAQGYLDDTIERYRHAVWDDYHQARFAAVLDGGPMPLTDAQRLDLGLSPAVLAVVAVAFAARWGLGRLRGPREEGAPPRGPHWLGLLAASLESVWLLLVFIPLAALPGLAGDWFGGLRAGAWLAAVRDDVTGGLGEIGNPFAIAAGAVFAVAGLLLANAQTVVLAPVAWLTVGAVVYGHRLAGPARDHEERHAGRGGRVRQWVRGQVRGDLHDRFGPLLGGLRLLASGSTRPLLLVCLLFVAFSPLVVDGHRLGGLEAWLWDLERWIVGPRDDQTWLLLDQMLNPLNEIVANVVLICLLSAAIDRLVLARRPDPDRREAAARPEPADAPEPVPAAAAWAPAAEAPARNPEAPFAVPIGARPADPLPLAEDDATQEMAAPAVAPPVMEDDATQEMAAPAVAPPVMEDDATQEVAASLLTAPPQDATPDDATPDDATQEMPAPRVRPEDEPTRELGRF